MRRFIRIDLPVALDQLVGRFRGKAAPPQQRLDAVVERGILEPAFEPRALRFVELDPLQHLRPPNSARKFELAELHRLKTARRIEMVAKLIELLRRHGLENIDLLLQEPLDRVDSPKSLRDAPQVIAIERRGGRVELVQELLEPELVNLVNDDEQHLVVMRRLGERLLKSQQLVNLEIRSVREGH